MTFIYNSIIATAHDMMILIIIIVFYLLVIFISMKATFFVLSQKVCIGSDKGLTYTTIQFTETQLNEGRKAPPKQDSTTYASIDFSNKGE